jgi:hypothetical protein
VGNWGGTDRTGAKPQGTTRVFDLHPDGARVVIAKPRDEGKERDTVVAVFNFFEEIPHAMRALPPPFE